MTWSGSVNQSPLHRVIFLSAVSLLTGCAAMESAPSERLTDLRTKAQACSEALPAISQYDVDRFGRVRASAQGPEAGVFERNFFDCVSARGRWTTWLPGQPAPMLEPLGTDPPDPNLGVRVP
jgi:hypothetical protein